MEKHYELLLFGKLTSWKSVDKPRRTDTTWRRNFAQYHIFAVSKVTIGNMNKHRLTILFTVLYYLFHCSVDLESTSQDKIRLQKVAKAKSCSVRWTLEFLGKR